MKKIIIATALVLVLALFLSGCTQTSLCGDQICSSGEESTCPGDCVAPVEAKVNISVNGAYDAVGDLSLYWYSSKDIQASAYSNITSRLGDNWFGSESKNLYVSFNDSKNGQIPVPTSRQISMNFTQAGDYYFEARSEDYSYRAVSEKITITESGEYNVNLTLTPSNPALRVKVFDEYGNTLNGKGIITLTAVETVCEYGECKENEWQYDSRVFYDKEEMNGLFFLYIPYQYNFKEKRDMYYKIEVQKEGYSTQTGYHYPYGKYSEYHMSLGKEVPAEKGILKIKIVPGVGTSVEDLAELDGANVQACGKYACYDSTIRYAEELTSITFEGMLYDNYAVYGYVDYNYQSSHPPMSLVSSNIEVNSEIVYGEAKGLRGYGMQISILDSMGNLIDTVNEELYGLQSCYVYSDGVKNCSSNEEPQRIVLPSNPVQISQRAYSEEEITNPTNVSMEVELMYKGEKKWFSYSMKQGYHEYIWQFSGNNVDRNYSTKMFVGNSINVENKDLNYCNSKVMQLFLFGILQNADYNNSLLARFDLRCGKNLVEVKVLQQHSSLTKAFDNVFSTPVSIGAVRQDTSENYFVDLYVE